MLFTIIVLFLNAPARADLLAPGCGAVASKPRAEMLGGPEMFAFYGEPAEIILARNTGLSCETVTGIFGAAEAVHMAIVPAAMVMNVPGVREEILGQMATMGLTLANPAVLGIGMLGAVGYVTIYFVLKEEAKACEKAEMQEAIRREVEARLNIHYSKPIEVRR